MTTTFVDKIVESTKDLSKKLLVDYLQEMKERGETTADDVRFTATYFSADRIRKSVIENKPIPVTGTPELTKIVANIINEARTQWVEPQIELFTGMKVRGSPQIWSGAVVLVVVIILLKLVGWIVGMIVEAISLGQIEKADGWAESIYDALTLSQVAGAIVEKPLKPSLYTPLEYEMNELFPTKVPPVADLIRFVVRECFPLEPLPEAPEEFKRYMLKHGFGADWCKAYWFAHWELISFERLVDAYHRGLITSEELDTFIRWHDYSPDPRPGIQKSDIEILRGLLKTLIPRVDLRRGWELGELTDKELLERYKALGYEEDAQLMTDIQIAIALDAEKMAVARQLRRQYELGVLSRERLEAALEELPMPKKRISLFIQELELRRELEEKEELIKAAREQFRKGKIGIPQMETELKKIGVEPWRIETIKKFELARQKLVTT